MGWKNLGIGKKLGIGFGGLMLLLALISFGAVAGISSLMAEFDRVDQHTQLVVDLEKKEREHFAWLNELSRAIITGTTAEMTLELDGHNCALGRWYYGEGLKKAKSLAPELGGMIEKLEAPHLSLHASAAAIREVSRRNPAGAKAATEEIYNQQTLPALRDVRQILGDMVAKLESERASAWLELVETRKIVRTSIMIVGAGALLFGLIIAIMTTRGILRPVRGLTEAAEKIAEGQLDQTIRVNTRDEIGQLASAFNKMTQVIVKNLKAEVDRSGKLVQSVKEAIHQLSTSANEILAISTQQASGATQQASAVQEATTTAEEIAATSRQVAQNALQVESQAEQANHVCTDGIATVDHAVRGMVQLRTQVQAIAEAMLQLGENSQKIGGIVDIIDEISDQTNLLALNAAIEAAGAGEAGKRFTIVAGEVKRLAERTVDATRQIKGLIEQIQKATNSTIMLTEDGTKGVDAASTRVEGVSVALANIIAVVQETTTAAREIKLSTQQQTTASEQMAETIIEVRDVASQVAASAEETTQAIAELTGLAENLREMLEDELQNKGREKAKAGAVMLEKVLSEALAKGLLTLEDLFDENYVPIPGTDPPKFHTRYDVYLDRTITGLQDAFLDDIQVVYAVLVDRNGYLPTHNSKFTQPLTGNRQKDLVGNRTKRMFNTPNELAAARNTSRENVLVQVYHRDTGEKMWDISFPVYVRERHWGAFRLGYCM